MTVSIRTMTRGDFAQADAVARAAFERTASFLPMLNLHIALEPEGLWAAWLDGRVVGTASAIDYGPLAYLGLMTVHPSAQRRGIGRALLETALVWLDARQCPVVLLDATEKGAPLYAQYGFVCDAKASEWTADEPRVPAGCELNAVRVEVPHNAAELAVFEAPYFGANRQKLLAQLLACYPDRCSVSRGSDGRVNGFLIAREPLIGPWCAESPAIAANLLACGLNRPRENPPLVQVPRSNVAAEALLTRFGFRQRRRLDHMRRGGSAPPGKASGLFGQASFGHG